MLYRVTRRTFLKELGGGVIAIAVLGPIAGACSTTSGSTTTSGNTTTGAGTPITTSTTTAAATTTTTPPGSGDPELVVRRIGLDFVSAYALARGTEAAVVDTGVAGSEGEIAAGLSELGLSWGNVGHVVLTHLHPDHIGSLGAVMTAAAGAVGYAGAADIPSMDSPRELVPVTDGDAVFGLEVIATPGHTAGHISLLDPAASVLIAGDALNGADGGVAGPNPRFSADHDLALESARKLAGFDYERAFFGHGEPVTSGASQLVAALAAES